MVGPTDKRQISDEELLRRVYSGDQEAFSVLVERHQGSLWSSARWIAGNDTVAEDACQQTWVDLVERINDRTYDIKEGCLGPFLHKVVRNEVINIHRRKGRLERALENVKKTVPDRGDDPVETIIAAEIQEIIKSTLLKFSEKEREAFKLYYLLPPGLSFKDTGEKLGVSLGTARNYVNRVLNELRKILGEGEIDYGRKSHSKA